MGMWRSALASLATVRARSPSVSSVAAMARSLLGGFSVEYSGDPLADMTLASFLDKWLQKKPKRLKQSRGGSETMAKRRGESGAAEAFAPGTREFAALAEA